MGEEVKQVVPRVLPLPFPPEALLFYFSWGHAHLREGSPQETRMLLGVKKKKISRTLLDKCHSGRKKAFNIRNSI